MQSEINAYYERARDLDVLTFEVLNNLVVEMTRLGIDIKNYKMRLESVSSRLDFDERRARAVGGYRAVPAGRGGARTRGHGPERDRERRRGKSLGERRNQATAAAAPRPTPFTGRDER